MSLELTLQNAALVLGLMTSLWVFSVVKRDASIVDPWWSMAFLLVTVHTAFRTGLSAEKVLLLTVVALWSVRLWLHLLARSIGQPEDPRYAAFRQRFGPKRYWWFSFFQVFLLQGVLVMLVSAPLVVAASAGPHQVRGWAVAGAVLSGFGLLLEAIADAQLQRFRRAKTGGVLDTGLWRYSRHPNYFGEAVVWWGFGVYALGEAWGALALLGPALMTFLLVRVSGVAMLDAHLMKTKPGYAEYVRRTASFMPWPPKR